MIPGYRRNILACCIAWCSFSCGSDQFRIDTTGVDVAPVKISRFDRMLFSMDSVSYSGSVETIRNRYGAFFDGFAQQIIYNKGPEDSLFPGVLMTFISDPGMRQLYDSVQAHYPDLTSLEMELTEVFKRCRYFFPKAHLPGVTACVTGLNLPMSFSDSLIGIGLDMYLGKGSGIYDLAQLEQYRRENMNQGNIIPDFIRAWAMSTFERKEKKTDVLSEIIFNGKILYLTEALAPGLHDTIRIGYTNAELEWCKKNEENIWGFLVQDEKLFSTEDEKIAQFNNEGPFTPGFNKESPSRTGRWIGWMIVRKFMQENPEITLEQLMDEHDPNRILKDSHYKPS